VAAILAALRPEKNHELFLRMAARIVRTVPKAKFLVIGDGVRRQELETMAHELRLEGTVRFLGTRGDVPELLALVDTLVLTSHMEANPVSILEALACEKPVVATNVGSISESVQDGVSGYLVPPGNEAELAKRVESLLIDRQLAHRLGKAGRENVEANWSLEAMVDGYQELIQSIYLSKCVSPAGIAAPADSAEEMAPAVDVAS
jgi:glycosyltransferase involved in cell wall biosynthesis